MSPPDTTPTPRDQHHSLPENRQVGVPAPTPKRQAIRFLMRELGITGAQANRLYSAYLLDLRDEHAARQAHAEAVAAGAFSDARAVARETFRAWFSRRGDVVVQRARPRASDPRWRTVSA